MSTSQLDQIDRSVLMEVLERGRWQNDDMDKKGSWVKQGGGERVYYEMGAFYISYQVWQDVEWKMK